MTNAPAASGARTCTEPGAKGTRAERNSISSSLCLPTAPMLPIDWSGDFGTSPFFGQLSGKRLLVCINLDGTSNAQYNRRREISIPSVLPSRCPPTRCDRTECERDRTAALGPGLPIRMSAFAPLAGSRRTSRTYAVGRRRSGGHLLRPHPEEAAKRPSRRMATNSACAAMVRDARRLVPAATASLGILASPVVGVIAAMIVLGERPTVYDTIGFALMLSASAVVLLKPDGAASPSR